MFISLAFRIRSAGTTEAKKVLASNRDAVSSLPSYGELLGQPGKRRRAKVKTKAFQVFPKKCNSPFSNLEAVAADRDTWKKSTRENGVADFIAAPRYKLQITEPRVDMQPQTLHPAFPAVPLAREFAPRNLDFGVTSAVTHIHFNSSTTPPSTDDTARKQATSSSGVRPDSQRLLCSRLALCLP